MAMLYFTKREDVAITQRDRLCRLWQDEFHAVANQLNNKIEWGMTPITARVQSNKTLDDAGRLALYNEIAAGLVEAGYRMNSDTFSLRIEQPWWSSVIRVELVL